LKSFSGAKGHHLGPHKVTVCTYPCPQNTVNTHTYTQRGCLGNGADAVCPCNDFFLFFSEQRNSNIHSARLRQPATKEHKGRESLEKNGGRQREREREEG